jgi:hypothetical protein
LEDAASIHLLHDFSGGIKGSMEAIADFPGGGEVFEILLGHGLQDHQSILNFAIYLDHRNTPSFNLFNFGKKIILNKALLHLFNLDVLSDRKYMRTFVALLLIFGSFSCFSQVREKFVEEYDAVNDKISEDYEAGAYLIYDCENKHYTCVLEEYFKSCESKVQEDLTTASLHHRCAPIGKLTTKKACFQKQLFMVSNNAATPFCTKDEWKKKELFLN